MGNYNQGGQTVKGSQTNADTVIINKEVYDAQIVLTRKEQFINAFVVFDVYIDNRMVGRISNGETRRYAIASGHHTLHVHMLFP